MNGVVFHMGGVCPEPFLVPENPNSNGGGKMPKYIQKVYLNGLSGTTKFMASP